MFIPTGQTKQQFVERTRAERQQREKERKDKDKTNQQEAAVVRIQQWWKQQKTLAAVRNECWTLWDEQLLLHHEATSILDLFYLVGLYCLFSKRSTLQTKGRLPIVCKYLAQKYPGTTKDTVISYHALLVDVRYMERARRYLCHILHQCLDQMCLGKNMEDQTMYLTGLELSTLVYFLNPKTYKIPSLLSIDCAVESAMEVVRVAALKVIKESLLTYSSSMLRNSAIVRVARMAKIEDRGKTHSKGPLSPEDTRIIQSIKLWLTTLTRISMFPLEYAPTATHLWTTAEALDCVVTIVLGIPLLTTLLEPNMLSLLPTWHLLNTKGKNGAQWIDSLEGNGGLFLLANLVDGWQKLGIQPSDEPKVTQAADGLLSMITPYFSERQTKHHCCYHPLFKWSSAIWGNTLPASVFDRVILQIHFLWSRAFMDPSFTPILTFEAKESQKEAPKSFGGPFFQSFHKKKSQPESQNLYGQLAEFSMDVEILFSMYTQLILLFPDQRRFILARIAFIPQLIPQLWKVMNSFGPRGQMLIYLDAAKKQDGSEIEKEPLIQVLKLFCEICSLVFLTLDDTDIFQKETPFSIKHLIDLSGFLNVFYFALVQQQGSTPTTLPNSVHSFHAARRLLLQLYDLDVRHSYCPQGHWLLVPDPSTKPSVLSLLNASSPKPSEFLTHFRQGDRMPLRILQLMPHTVSFDTRLKIFRDWIYMDRATSTTTRSKVITVRRNHVLEDGFSGLSDLPSSAWKSTIRVSFVNELGMEEAGIDQGGPFKDFISLFIADALKPSCGLFDSTPTTHLFYPSPMSHLQGQSIEYFNLIGKIIGKAVYEGILLEAQFASFLLAKLLGRNVFLEELRELDEDMWRSLNIVKHYKDNIENLDLCFATDEQEFGKIVTYELKYRGSQMTVNDNNKVEYVYLMADYKLNQRAKEQTQAFIQGFRSVIFDGWIKVFSPIELQRVISGEDTDFDTPDLRRHTTYQNGYFDQHPVIRSLWQIIDILSSEEKRSFLKFVTGCSKPPLGGFGYLQPPFTIRMVSPDGEQPSVEGFGLIKTFFKLNIKSKHGRLPTSSTCFNLLKLPAYTRKTLLKEKLLYAIHSNTGFELS